MRIDPASTQGTVTVEIALEGELPRGARADMRVDGTIEIEHLPNVMYVGRPAYGSPRAPWVFSRSARTAATRRPSP
jgi:HlyD family secretion protein